MSRPPTPPPPDVPWTIAAHELSKLLIPNSRQVDSCTHAELNVEAKKPKKTRHSLQPGPIDASHAQPAPTRMSLRERKPVSYLEDDDFPSRRRTVAGPAVLATAKVCFQYHVYSHVLKFYRHRLVALQRRLNRNYHDRRTGGLVQLLSSALFQMYQCPIVQPLGQVLL